MKKISLNRRFLLLQGMLALIECISVSYLSAILMRYGYRTSQIGFLMMLAACAAMLCRPAWGFLNDRLPCARQVTFFATATGVVCFFVLTHANGQPVLTAFAVVGINMTNLCMMNFADSWAMRLISTGQSLNYGATRAGGSFTYAIGAALFGFLSAQFGFRPGSIVLFVLLIPLALIIWSLPNPVLAAQTDTPVSLKRGLHHLGKNSTYLLMLAALFLCTLATSATDSFFSVLLLELGGSEKDVGIALFLQAICEIPVMVGYVAFRARFRVSAATLLSVSMLFYSIKSFALGCATTCGAAVLTSLLQMFSFALFMPACVDFILETVHADYLATAHLIFMALGQGLAAMIGNYCNGLLADLVGTSTMFRMVSILALVAFLLALFTAVRQKRRALT